MNQTEKEKKKRIIFTAVFVLLYAALLLPYLLSIPYSLPGSDDFSLAAGVDALDRIRSSIYLTNRLYVKMGGGIWIAKFFELLLNPIVGPATGITLLVYFLIFFTSCQFFFRSLFRYGFKITNRLFREGLILASTAALLTGGFYPEAFYWFSGATYEIFMALLFLFGGLLLCFHGTGKKGFRYGALVTGTVCCMNIPYTVPVILFYLYVMIFMVSGKPEDKKNPVFRKEILVPFLFFVGGSLIYLLSPGVRARSVEVGSAGISVKSLLTAVINDLKIVVIRGGMIVLHCPVQVLMLLGVFFSGIKSKEPEGFSGKKQAILFVTALLSVLGAVFPVVLGYGTYEVPNRIGFVIDMLLLTSGVIVLFALGVFLRPLLEKKKVMTILITIVMFLSVIFYAAVAKSGKGVYSAPIKTVCSLSAIREEHDDWMEILSGAENASDTDVVIEHSPINETGILNPTGLWEDGSWWVNGALGRFLWKNRIAIRWK